MFNIIFLTISRLLQLKWKFTQVLCYHLLLFQTCEFFFLFFCWTQKILMNVGI